jgi:hypothetical protein
MKFTPAPDATQREKFSDKRSYVYPGTRLHRNA